LSSIGLFLPTYQGAKILAESLPALARIKRRFSRCLVIDSSSRDASAQMARDAGFEVQTIPLAEFDHGGTRQRAIELLSDCDIIVFMTQDAILAEDESLDHLLDAFKDDSVAIAYGRQLPRQGAKLLEAHARLFGYPSVSMTKSLASVPLIGLRAAVVSNSFAAYRRDILLKLGGFQKDTLFAEDTLAGAKAILANYKIAYVADATVYHSHSYTLRQEFCRYFDNGVFYGREKWILDAFGKAEGSGLHYLASEIRYLLGSAPWLIPLSLLRSAVKYMGYRVGVIEHWLPISWKMRISMNPSFWRREAARRSPSMSDAPS